MKKTAEKLRQKNVKKWTHGRIAEALGIARQTVTDWFTKTDTPIAGAGNRCRPDARVKVNVAAKEKIAERVQSGEAQAAVAADFGISQQQASTIV